MKTAYAATLEDWVHDGPNQDDLALADDLRAGAVFDGLAGHPGSWNASALAAQVTTQRFAARPHRDWARDTAHAARDALLAARKTNAEFPMMTCAAVFACIDDNQLQVAWCGDCRAYRLRADGFLVRLTDDHDVIYEQVLYGRISPQRAAAARFALEDADTASEAWHRGGAIAKKAFKRSHMMISELSSGPIDLLRLDWDPASTLILTTDGVHDNLLGSQLRQLAKVTPVDQLAGTLVAAARQRALAGEGRAHSDDITCVVLPPADRR